MICRNHVLKKSTTFELDRIKLNKLEVWPRSQKCYEWQSWKSVVTVQSLTFITLILSKKFTKINIFAVLGRLRLAFVERTKEVPVTHLLCVTCKSLSLFPSPVIATAWVTLDHGATIITGKLNGWPFSYLKAPPPTHPHTHIHTYIHTHAQTHKQCIHIISALYYRTSEFTQVMRWQWTSLCHIFHTNYQELCYNIRFFRTQNISEQTKVESMKMPLEDEEGVESDKCPFVLRARWETLH